MAASSIEKERSSVWWMRLVSSKSWLMISDTSGGRVAAGADASCAEPSASAVASRLSELVSSLTGVSKEETGRDLRTLERIFRKELRRGECEIGMPEERRETYR